MINQLRPLAEDGDRQAIFLLAWAYAQQGQWQEGLQYAMDAVKSGAPHIAGNYIGNMVGSPEHREQFFEMLEAALENGYSADPLGWLPQLAQRGDNEGVAKLVELASRPWPRPRPDEWDRLVQEMQAGRERFGAEVEQVEQARMGSIDAIKEHETAVEGERKRLEDLGHTVETLAHEAAADELSRQYAQQAKRSERISYGFTTAALLVGAGAAVLAAVFTLEQARDQDPDVLLGLAKAAIAIPIALFAAYLGRLAGSYRNVAWRWRHMELQLRTAEPYIAELDGPHRARIIEALALRFFPGQPIHPEGVEGGPPSPGSEASPVSIQLPGSGPPTVRPPEPERAE